MSARKELEKIIAERANEWRVAWLQTLRGEPLAKQQPPAQEQPAQDEGEATQTTATPPTPTPQTPPQPQQATALVQPPAQQAPQIDVDTIRQSIENTRAQLTQVIDEWLRNTTEALRNAINNHLEVIARQLENLMRGQGGGQ